MWIELSSDWTSPGGTGPTNRCTNFSRVKDILQSVFLQVHPKKLFNAVSKTKLSVFSNEF